SAPSGVWVVLGFAPANPLAKETETAMENVAVVGASEKTDRYSNKAMRMLAEHGHNPIPVAPAKKTILERTAYPNLADVPDALDTVTLYLGPGRQPPVLEAIVARRPRRVIFNPGAENPEAYDQLKNAGIKVVEACTLVMLRTGQF
ncbi:MAG: CoA-binding protein, partial [Thermodesulfobacteriota bacterium]